jgi:hypothetical protein
MYLRAIVLVSTTLYSLVANALDPTIQKSLRNALTCSGTPESAVYELVDKGSDFRNGYAAYGFGEGTSYSAVVILEKPLKFEHAETNAVISGGEGLYFDFGAFTFARFKGDYRKIVAQLHLVEQSNPGEALGKYVSNPSGCPRTIALTPLENGEFLLGCGWHNGC